MSVKDAELGELSLFEGLTRTQLEQASALCTLVDVPSGRVLCAEGALGREVFVVVSGAAAVSRHGEVVALAGPGEVLGEAAVLGDHLRAADVVTLEPSVLLVMSAAEFVSLLDAVPVVADRVRAQSARRHVPAPVTG